MTNPTPLDRRQAVLLWWARNPAMTASQVAGHLNGPAGADLPGEGRVKAATLRQWKARHGLPDVPAPGQEAAEDLIARRGRAAPPAGPADQAQAESLQPAAVWVRLSSINPWDDNPRDNDDAAVRVAESIARFGFGRAFVGWRSQSARMLVVGHTARKATLLLIERRPVYAFQAGDDGKRCRDCKAKIKGGKHTADCALARPPGSPGEGLIPMRWRDDWDEAEARGYAIADNQLGTLAGWAAVTLADQLQDLQLHDLDHGLLGFDPSLSLEGLLAELTGGDGGPGEGGGSNDGNTGVSLVEQFGVPPFTVLDARQGYWQDRKRWWWALGLDPAAGRTNLGSTANASEGKVDYMTGRGGHATGGSAFDPVLAEISMRWFCPEGGHVLDCFAGESVKGVVAGVLGYQYTGVEVREEQVQANRDQWATVCSSLADTVPIVEPNFVHGDSTKIGDYLPDGVQYDCLITSPPYYDLEVYSDQDDDGSTKPTYAGFMAWYRQIFEGAVAHLRDGAFVVVKVGDVRSKSGGYVGFTPDNVRMFMDMGLHYYNEAVLVTPLGTLPVRAGPAMRASRKLGKGHQNVLVFWKGDPSKIRATLGELPERYLADPAVGGGSESGEG